MKSNLNTEEFDIVLEFYLASIRVKPSWLTISNARLIVVDGVDVSDVDINGNSRRLAKSLSEAILGCYIDLAEWRTATCSKKKRIYIKSKVKSPSDSVFTAAFQTAIGNTCYSASKKHGVNQASVSALMSRLERYDKASEKLSLIK